MRGSRAGSSIARGAALRDDLAVRHERHLVGDVGDVLGRMDGDAAPSCRSRAAGASTRLDHARGAARIEAAERLVEEQQGLSRSRARGRGRRAGAGRPTSRPGRRSAKLAEIDRLERLGDARLLRALEAERRAHPEADVLARGQMREQVVVLEHHGDRAIGRGERQEVPAAKAGGRSRASRTRR